MRQVPWNHLDQYRDVRGAMASPLGADYGRFMIAAPTGHTLCVVASNGAGWEHVSVSLPNRCPNWPEMCFVKAAFWLPEEAVMQLHPPKSDWRSLHPFCLHLWRPTKDGIPLPPGIMVAPHPNKDEAAELAHLDELERTA